jgi:hypothetical protein
MVDGLTQALEDAHRSSCIDSGTSKNFLEQIRAHCPGARERHQTSSWSQQFDTEKIDVFVFARGSFDVTRTRGVFRRIENDDIELQSAIAHSPQHFECVTMDQFAWIDIIESGIAPSTFEG